MDRKVVCHVSTDATAKGSRIASQIVCQPNAEIVTVKPNSLVCGRLIVFARKERNSVFIFHQQSLLPLLCLMRLFLFATGRPQKIIYDMHDLAEVNKYMSRRGRVATRAHQVLENIVTLCGIETITVSKGLAETYAKRVKKRPKIYYNVNFNYSRFPQRKDNENQKKIVYFGQIKKERIELDDVSRLVELGYSIDLYGRFSPSAGTSWRRRLLDIVAHGGGRYLGPYESNKMDFLARYDYSLMAFRSKRMNIKFCMPNKLFQSLSAGLICIVSDSMGEILDEFSGLGCVRKIEDMSATPLESIASDWHSIQNKLRSMEDFSVQQMSEAIR